MSDTTITVSGRLTRDPEHGYTPAGVRACKMSIATNHSYKRGDEWVQEEPAFWTIKVYGRLADAIDDTVMKGVRVVVTGRPHIRQYETKHGTKQNAPEIYATDIGISVLNRNRENAEIIDMSEPF